MSWESPSDEVRRHENELGSQIQRRQAKAKQALAKERRESAQRETAAFNMDAKLNKRIKKWRAKKNIVAVLNSLKDIVPKCAPSFSVPERFYP